MPSTGMEIMKFGVNVLNFGPYATPSFLRGWARFVEDSGFHIAMISDHLAVTPDVAQQYPAPFYEPFSTLAWFAGLTERIELGTTVTVLPYRNPLQTARVAANIDRFSEGRMVLGVGVGWAGQEYDALDVPYGKRGAITDEYLAAITNLWTHEVASMAGEFVSFREVATDPRPARTPHCPIWVGGSSRAAIRRAVRYGDAWHPVHPGLGWLRERGIPALLAEAESHGRPTPALAPRIRLQVTDSPLDEQKRGTGQGTLEQIRSDLQALADLGAGWIVFDTYAGAPERLTSPQRDWDMLERLAESVIDLSEESLR